MVLLGRNFDFLGGYVVVTARYLVVTGVYCSLLVVTACYQSLLLVPTFSMNEKKRVLHNFILHEIITCNGRDLPWIDSLIRCLIQDKK